jgi:hypothetical protein
VAENGIDAGAEAHDAFDTASVNAAHDNDSEHASACTTRIRKHATGSNVTDG